jgi:TonB family protein
MQRVVTTILIAGILAPWVQLAAQDTGTTSPKPPIVMVSPGPRTAVFSGSRLIDIPDWAKTEGHNGWVVWIVRVGADGKPLSTTLKRSSGSSAIDSAAKARLDSGRFSAAITKDGEKVDADLEIQFDYFQWNTDGKAGGLKSYTCGDLVREFEWFSRANKKTGLLYPLRNYYTSLDSIADNMNGRATSFSDMQLQRQQREKMWSKLVKTCHKHPSALFLDQVDQRDLFLTLARM